MTKKPKKEGDTKLLLAQLGLGPWLAQGEGNAVRTLQEGWWNSSGTLPCWEGVGGRPGTPHSPPGELLALQGRENVPAPTIWGSTTQARLTAASQLSNLQQTPFPAWQKGFSSWHHGGTSPDTQHSIKYPRVWSGIFWELNERQLLLISAQPFPWQRAGLAAQTPSGMDSSGSAPS